MVHFKNDQTISVISQLRGGNGDTVSCELLKKEEMCGHGRQFALLTLAPGCSIGVHPHNGESETYYILSGVGRYNDNGTDVTVQTGDCAYCPSGECHGLANLTDEPLVFVSLIINA